MNELLDYEKPERARKNALTGLGKAFYIVEALLWIGTGVFGFRELVAMSTMYFTLFFLLALVVFYLVAGTLFPFYSGVFKFNYDRIGVLLGMLAIAIFIFGIISKMLILSVPYVIFPINTLVSFGVLVFLFGRMYPSSSNILLKWMDFGAYDELSISHLRYMLARAILIFFMSLPFLAG